MNNKECQPEFKSDQAKEKSEELLKSVNLLDEVNKKEIIFSAAKEAYREKSMDSPTLVYRLAMAVYHSGRGADSSIVSAIDNPSDVYLVFLKSSLYQEHKEDFTEMMESPLDLRINVMKVLIAFAISTYVYNKGGFNDD